MRTSSIIALAVGAVFLTCVPARAGETTVGVTLDATIGVHTEPRDGTTTLPLLPIPFFSIEHREGRFSIFLEGVPPIGPVAIQQSASAQTVTTRISMFDGALRYALPGSRVWVGIGESVINQSTDYRYMFSEPSGGYTVTILNDEVQTSRVVGARFEIGADLWHNAHQRLDVSVAASPHMHAMLVDQDLNSVTTTDPSQRGGFGTVTFEEPETASLVDAQARWSWTHGRSTLGAGLRYINHVSIFDNVHAVADRNRFLLPFLGWSTKL